MLPGVGAGPLHGGSYLGCYADKESDVMVILRHKGTVEKVPSAGQISKRGHLPGEAVSGLAFL